MEMTAVCLKIGLYVGLLAVIVSVLRNRYVGLSTPEIIEKYGYKSETHYVTSQDGYVLQYHRIPHGRTGTTGKGPVLLMHGIVGSSATFVQLGPERGLGFILADLGYDVWLGNCRGNSYSRNNTNPSWNREQFYNFTIHEMSYNDIPSAIDYILHTTGETSLHYVGLSFGTTQFFVFATTRTEYHNKVKLASLLAPVAVLEHFAPTGILRFFISNIDTVESVCNFFHLREVPLTGFVRVVVPPLCATPIISYVCQNAFAWIIGSFDNARFNKDFIPVIAANSPSNFALKPIFHLGQLAKSRSFQMFDYGTISNKVLYGSETTPLYDLTQIKIPVAVYYGQMDKVATPEDTQIVLKQLPNLANDYLVPSPTFRHADFVYSTNIKTLLFNEFLSVMNFF